MIEKLLKIADELDRSGLHTEADEIVSGIEEVLVATAAAKKEKAKGRGRVLISANQAKDNKDHLPYNSENQAKNMVARVNQFAKVPPWAPNGMTLKQLVEKAYRAAKKAYPGVEWTEVSRKPGKG